MQLKWNHRFVPYNNDTTPTADRSATSSPMPAPTTAATTHARLQTLPPLSSAASPIPSPALPNINRPLAPLPSTARHDLVIASCAKCNAHLGTLHNSWHQVTNSYYLQLQAGYRVEGLQVQGPLKEPGTQNTVIQGCLIQTLVCIGCIDVLGFFCVEVPKEKGAFRHRQFLKLSKINLMSQKTKTLVDPQVDRPLEEPQEVPSSEPAFGRLEQSGRSAPTVPSTPRIEEDKYKHADMVAVKSTNNATQTWQEAHEDWAKHTKLTLSPGAFGRRILELGGGQRPKPVDGAPPVSSIIQHANHSALPKINQPLNPVPLSRTGSHSSPNPNTTLPSIAQAIVRPLEERSEREHLSVVEEQRRDINRLDMAVRRLQASFDALTGSVDSLRHSVRSRPLAGRTNSDDISTIDLISDAVSNLTSKVGEVDGLRLQVEGLKRRLKRVEEGTIGAGPNTPGDNFFHKPAQTQQRYESPFGPVHSHTPPKLPPLNSLKRALEPSEDSDSKRTRPEAYEYQTAPLHVPYPPQYKPLINAPPNRELAPPLQRPRSDDSMYTARRGPGRPPKKPQDGHQNLEHNLSNPALWEHENFTPSVDADGYYRPLAPTAIQNDNNIIQNRTPRRDSIQPPVLQFDSKKTRQRPMRNSEGILIRKDGKPDGRSVSSAQNLKRFYDRKMGDGADGADVKGEGDSMSPGGEMMGREYASGEDEEMCDERQESRRESDVDGGMVIGAEVLAGGEHETEGNAASEQKEKSHYEVMSKMFPKGVNSGRTRLDQSAESLVEQGQTKTQGVPLQDRDALVKQEAVDPEPALMQEKATSDPVLGTQPSTASAAAEMESASTPLGGEEMDSSVPADETASILAKDATATATTDEVTAPNDSAVDEIPVPATSTKSPDLSATSIQDKDKDSAPNGTSTAVTSPSPKGVQRSSPLVMPMSPHSSSSGMAISV